MVAARAAVRSMIDLLIRQHGMPAIDAYLLCSVCGDLRISENRRRAELDGVLLFSTHRIRVMVASPESLDGGGR